MWAQFLAKNKTGNKKKASHFGGAFLFNAVEDPRRLKA